MKPRNIFLTGASAGIGLETARALCAKGHQVWGTARSVSRLPKMENFHPLELDLTHSESIRAAFEAAIVESCGLDVVISNAGSASFGALETFPAEEVRKHFETLVFGPLDLMQQAIAHFRERDAGLVILVTSLSVRLPIPFLAPYSAAKAALSALASAQRLELGDSKVRVVDYQPGDIRTDFHRNTPVLPSPEVMKAKADRAWSSIDKTIRSSPEPSLIAVDLARIVEMDHPPVVRARGEFFQQWIAPLGPRFLPLAWLEKAIRAYYRI